MRDEFQENQPECYALEIGASPTGDSGSKREAALRVMSAAAFLIFFQAYLVAPLIPALSIQFHESTDFLGMLVPAYMLPYGISTLFYGPISDRVGRKPVILSLLGLMVATIAGVATAHTASQMMIWRLLGGIAGGGIVPIALALLGHLFPYEQRGRPMGWMFGAIAGGMAFGSSLGALLNPIIGWRAEFLITAGLSAAVLAFAIRLRQFLGGEIAAHPLSPGKVIAGYWSLFTSSRGARTYAYILLRMACFIPVSSPGLVYISRSDIISVMKGSAWPCWAMAFQENAVGANHRTGRGPDREKAHHSIGLLDCRPLLRRTHSTGTITLASSDHCDSLFGVRHEPPPLGWNHYFAQSISAGPRNGHERLFPCSAVSDWALWLLSYC